MRTAGVMIVALACLAFSAGPVAADDYTPTKCLVKVAGVCDGGAIWLDGAADQAGLVNGDTFYAYAGQAFKCRASVGRIYGPWRYCTVYKDCTVDFSKHFCEVTVGGICDGGSLYIQDVGTVENGDELCFPDYAVIKVRASVGKIYGPWMEKQIVCRYLDGRLDFSSKFCELEVAGICDGGSLYIQDVGTVENGDELCLPDYAVIKVRASVQEVYGPWMEKQIVCKYLDGELNFSKKFCVLKVTGICDGGSVYIYGLDGAVGTSVCLPDYAVIKCRAAVAGIYGPWRERQIVCKYLDGELDFSKKFCQVTIAGIPDNCRGVIDVDILETGVNGNSFCAPDGALLAYRARLDEIAGPWDKVRVYCKDGAFTLDTSRKWVDVCWIFKWTSSSSARTVFQGTSITVANGSSYCFPKGAQVCAAPDLGALTPDYECKVFWQDSCVYWKIICFSVEQKDNNDPE